MKFLLLIRLFDALILSRVQKLSDWMQVRIGGDNFGYAKAAYHLTHISIFYSFILVPGLRFMQDSFEEEVVKILFTLIISYPFFLMLRVVRFFEQRITSRYQPDQPFKKPLEDHPFGRACRDAAWIFCFLDIRSGIKRTIHEGFQVYLVFYFLFSFCNMLYIYFASCTPKPPKKEEKEVPIPANAVPDAV